MTLCGTKTAVQVVTHSYFPVGKTIAFPIREGEIKATAIPELSFPGLS